MKLPSQIATLFLCFFVASGTSCPEEEDIYPCECEEDDGELFLTCYGEEMSQQDIKNVLNRMDRKQIAVLELHDLHDVGKLKGDLFAGHDIRKLGIIHCDIEALTDGEKPAFSGLEDCLQELEISSSLEDSSSLQLSHLRALRELDLSYNQLNNLEAGCFPPSLEWLILSNNGIKSLADHAFANLVNLHTLWLDGNEFNTFSRTWLPVPMNELRDLELDNNHLTSLPRDAFSHMPSLRVLSLRTNGFRTLEKEALEGVWHQLSSIAMEGNYLVCDSRMEWIRQMEKKPVLFGTCHEPADVAGEDLQDWIEMASPE